ncbi:MAG TPA: hypothetical protein VD758_00875 [Gemmatimonadaceae bacterium]|nr:hypothetical protein [Gemmatimonadaceae bacterium]
MRRRPVALIGGVVVLAIACGKGKVADDGRPAPGVAHIHFNCGTEEGADIGVKPFRLKLDKRDGQLEWMLVGSDVDSVLLTPKPTSTWPFTAPPPLVVRKSANGIAKGIPETIQPGVYKYQITGFCIRPGGVVDTVGLDPDMIIPPLQ